jgi:hypothetical protein
LGTAAMAASRAKDKTYLGARYHRLAPRAHIVATHIQPAAGSHDVLIDVDQQDPGELHELVYSQLRSRLPTPSLA